MKRKLLLDSSWLAMAAALGRAGVVITSVVVARCLGKDQFGLVAMVQSTVLMFGGFLGVGFGMTATKILAERRAMAGHWPAEELSLLNAFNVGLAMFGALIVAGANSWVSQVTMGSERLAPLLLPGAWLLVVTAINFFQTGVLSGLEEYRSTAVANALSCMVTVTGILMGVFLNGAQGAILGHAAGMTITCAIFHRTVMKAAGVRPYGTNWPSFHGQGRMLMKLALPNTLLSWINAPVDWFCLAMLAHASTGPGEIAIFSACNQWCLLLRFFPMTVAAALLPATARASVLGTSNRSLFGFALSFNVSFTAVAALVIAFFSPWIIASYGSEFAGCSAVLYLLLASGTAISIQLAADRMLMGLDYAWSTFWINAIRGVAYISLAASFISYGALGLAAARCISSVLHAMVSTVAASVAVAHIRVEHVCSDSASADHDSYGRGSTLQAA